MKNNKLKILVANGMFMILYTNIFFCFQGIGSLFSALKVVRLLRLGKSADFQVITGWLISLLPISIRLFHSSSANLFNMTFSIGQRWYQRYPYKAIGVGDIGTNIIYIQNQNSVKSILKIFGENNTYLVFLKLPKISD